MIVLWLAKTALRNDPRENIKGKRISSVGVAAFAARFDFARRHLPLALPYLTMRKLANLVLNELELAFGVNRLRSLPPFLKLESTPVCHLACTGCLHSNPNFKKALGNRAHLTLETAQRAISGLQESLIGVSLSYTGEPLLNRSIVPIIAHLNASGHYTSFPTNLSVPLTREQARELVLSGLDLLMVSLDGTSAESYKQFRKGGNFDLIRRNVKLLASVKSELKRRRPYLLWKFIIFEHNKHEVAEAKRLRSSFGFDGLEFDVDHDSIEYTETVARRSSLKACYWVWNTTTIAWNGDVQPCCKQMNKLSMGHVKDGLRNVWNGRAYRVLRKSFTTDQGKFLNNVCRKCLGLEPLVARADVGNIE